MMWYILLGILLVAIVADQAWSRRARVLPRLYRPSPFLGWTMTPGVSRPIELVSQGKVVWQNDIHINKHGFNDREWTVPKPANRRRILVMGDSIIESRQIQRSNNFVALAEAQLNLADGDEVEIFNVGVAGWSVDSVLNYFQQVGKSLQPDLVILGIFIGNDLIEGDYDTFRFMFAYAWDCRRYDKPAFVLENGKLVRRNFSTWRNISARLFSEEIYKRSRSFRWIYQCFSRFMEKRYYGSNLLHAKGITFNMYMEQTKGTGFFYDQTEAQVDKLAEECRNAGAKFGVMLEPNFPLFYPLTHSDPQSRPYQEYQKDLAHYNEMRRRLEGKYPLLSIIEPLHAAGQVITFKPADPHFNADGHVFMAKLLADFIRRLI